MIDSRKTPSCCSASRDQLTPVLTKKTSSQASYHSTRMSDFKKKMVYIPGGSFLMGTEDQEGFPMDGEGPVREVTISPFYMDPYTVTNLEFKQFVESTHYITEAETFGWSFVFHLFVQSNEVKILGAPQQTPWWLAVAGAYWEHPEGPGSDIEERLDHPVVHISWNDAQAYCEWAGKRLPTEAEWEFAARGGLVQKRYPWGDELTPEGNYMCNIWQGQFPIKNEASDGFIGTSPVDTYEPNGYGLYQVSGNVWEWCSDFFSPTYHQSSQCINPIGPADGTSRSMRGGSYLCHKSYCNRYRVAARTHNTPDSSSGNVGFRCAADA